MKVLIDTGNLYFCVNKRFQNRRIDYQRLIEDIQERWGKADAIIAYVPRVHDDVKGFVEYLESLGVKVVSKQPRRKKVFGKAIWPANWLIEITLESVSDDNIILCTADPDFVPLMEAKSITIYASGIPRVMKERAKQAVEIEEEVLCDSE